METVYLLENRKLFSSLPCKLFLWITEQPITKLFPYLHLLAFIYSLLYHTQIASFLWDCPFIPVLYNIQHNSFLTEVSRHTRNTDEYCLHTTLLASQVQHLEACIKIQINVILPGFCLFMCRGSKVKSFFPELLLC